MRLGLSAALAAAALVGPMIATAYAEGDPAAGRRVWVRCAACHVVNNTGNHTVGPNLYKVVGRKAGTAAGFAYKSKVKDSGITWSEAELDKFLADPKALTAGSAMETFAGLANKQDRENVIAYIKDVSK